MPWLGRYFLASSPDGVAKTVSGAWPLIQRSLDEHEALMEAAGATAPAAQGRLDQGLPRRPRAWTRGMAELERLKPYGLNIDVLDPAGIAEREPFLGEGLIGALHFLDPGAVSDPGGLVKAYARLFREPGRRIRARAMRSTLEERPPGWRVRTERGLVQAREVVVALGPWSDLIFRPLGYDIPLGIKRGYHQHFRRRAMPY